jgi:hypothetical protein
MNDHDKHDDTQQPTRMVERLRREIERLGEAYGGDYCEVLDAYRHQAQAANRRARQARRQAIRAAHASRVANYELKLAKDIIEDIQRRQSR